MTEEMRVALIAIAMGSDLDFDDASAVVDEAAARVDEPRELARAVADEAKARAWGMSAPPARR